MLFQKKDFNALSILPSLLLTGLSSTGCSLVLRLSSLLRLLDLDLLFGSDLPSPPSFISSSSFFLISCLSFSVFDNLLEVSFSAAPLDPLEPLLPDFSPVSKSSCFLRSYLSVLRLPDFSVSLPFLSLSLSSLSLISCSFFSLFLLRSSSRAFLLSSSLFFLDSRRCSRSCRFLSAFSRINSKSGVDFSLPEIKEYKDFHNPNFSLHS